MKVNTRVIAPPFVQVPFPAVRAFQGGGQPQAVGSEAHLRDDAREVAGQVVGLVEDLQGVPPGQRLGVNRGGVVGADQQGRLVVTAAPEQADGRSERIGTALYAEGLDWNLQWLVQMRSIQLHSSPKRL